MFDFLLELGIECMFHKFTGLYCPGCGGTRSLHFLLNGDIIRSLLYHPILVYWTVGFSVNFIKLGYCTATGKAFRFRMAWVWWMLFIIGANFIVKNLFILHGVDLLTL